MPGMEQTAGLALQQTLSPQMQQSLHLLQAPLAELRQMVAAELQSNPALEEEIKPLPQEPLVEKGALTENWDYYYSQPKFSAEDAERRQFFLDSQTRPMSLANHLEDQLRLAGFDAQQNHIAQCVIGNLNEAGFLTCDLEKIATQSHSTERAVEKVLAVIQTFDPPGVAARDLRECLLLQLRERGKSYGLEARIVSYHLDELARKKLPEIAKALKTDLASVKRAAQEISQLEPRPGRNFSAEPEAVVVPEIFIEWDGEDFTVRLNQSEMPALKINDDYKDMLGEGTPELREYLREKIRGGRFFIRSIEQRQQTMVNIGREIVLRQREFMESGPDFLKPMTMSQVADAIGVHETTVSRAVAGKYLSTPHGVFEMKYFFTQGFQTSEGDSVSNEAVRRALTEIVAAENPKKPYSDESLMKILAERGIPVARRTVAKYREQLGILPSHLRKQF